MTRPLAWLPRALFALAAFASLSSSPLRAQVGSCTSPNQNNCYRFLCNGIDAGGTISNSCNNCGDASAPRWYQPTVPVRVDRTTAPAGLGTSGWGSVVDGSFQAWANVSTSNLVFQDIGAATVRSFGGNDNQHEIFWILNASEWQQKVGGGVNGALGVTIPRYGCGSPGQIFDADLVMNGVGFQWAATGADCSFGGCNSARSTLLHELGHFIGMGHPCTLCSWSIMSAQSGYDPEYPLGVDQAALTALYPGAPGGIGYGCTSDAQCNAGLSCVTDGELRYCSQACGTCPDGFECEALSGGSYCAFSAGALAGAVGVGESCTQRPCEESLICVGGGNEYICSETCTPGAANACSEGFSCFPLQGGGGACFNITQAGIGQFCDGANTICATGSTCVAESAQGGYCRRDCNPTTSAGCFADELCLPLQDANGNVVAGACFPAGNTPEGGICSSATDCARGTLCLLESANATTGRCFLRCDDGFACVDDRQQCISLGDVSYCNPQSGSLPPRPAPDAGTSPDSGTSAPPEGCRTVRGNYDCATKLGCVDDDGDGLGVCTEGSAGTLGIGRLCDEASQCDSGICHNGVCTRPCDAGNGCLEGYRCDEQAIPGGLCKAESCAADANICGEGYACTYSSASRYVCAVDEGGACACSASHGDRHVPFAGLVLLSGAFALALSGGRAQRRR